MDSRYCLNVGRTTCSSPRPVKLEAKRSARWTAACPERRSLASSFSFFLCFSSSSFFTGFCRERLRRCATVVPLWSTTGPIEGDVMRGTHRSTGGLHAPPSWRRCRLFPKGVVRLVHLLFSRLLHHRPRALCIAEGRCQLHGHRRHLHVAVPCSQLTIPATAGAPTAAARASRHHHG